MEPDAPPIYAPGLLVGLAIDRVTHRECPATLVLQLVHVLCVTFRLLC